MEPGESDLDVYRKRFADRMLRKGPMKELLESRQLLIREKNGQVRMRIPGVEIADEVFIGIQDYIVALENPLPAEPKKGPKRSYSFGSDPGDNIPEQERFATSQESLSHKQSPSSKSEILLSSSQIKNGKMKSAFEERGIGEASPFFSEALSLQPGKQAETSPVEETNAEVFQSAGKSGNTMSILSDPNTEDVFVKSHNYRSKK